MTRDDVEEAARLGVGRHEIEQRLDVAPDRGERRAQLVRDVGDEVAADPIGAAQAGDVVEDQHDALRAFARDTGGLRHDHLDRILGDRQLLGVGRLTAQGAADLRLDVRMADELDIAVPHRIAAHPQRPACRLVGELDDALLVHHQHAFDHPGQDGFHARAIAGQRGEAAVDHLERVVERAQHLAQLVGPAAQAARVVALGVGGGGGAEACQPALGDDRAGAADGHARGQAGAEREPGGDDGRSRALEQAKDERGGGQRGRRGRDPGQHQLGADTHGRTIEGRRDGRVSIVYAVSPSAPSTFNL